LADAPPPPTRRYRLRLIAAGVFAAPLLALPIYAAVRNMPARSATPAVYRAAPPPTPKPRLAKASAPAAAAKSTSGPADGPFVVRRILDTGGPIPYGDYFWDESGAPAGPIVVTVDLGAETLSVFRNGYEIGTAAIIFGAQGMDTPLGTFPITQKDADHISNLYDAPMPYMLRLTNDGISIHGSEVRYENATHGCIGIPLGLAKRLFGVVKLGDKVIVTKGKMIGLGQPLIGS
jgi:hypothetical protein